MPSIDERVVSMAFENTVFEQRVAQTMITLSKLDTAIKNAGSSSSGLQNIEASANKVTLQAPMSALDKLKAKLSGAGSGAAQGMGEIERASDKVQLEGVGRAVDKSQAKLNQLGAGSSFTDIEKASSRVTLEGLTRALDNVTSKFSVLQGAASVAMGNIAAQAAQRGAGFAKSFAFGPAKQGFEEYGTNLSSIQTILANTQGQQVSGLGATQSALGELNKYSDKTIYNFSEMAKNIGTFTAAGVDLPKSVESIKGIANLAALSGSNSQQASTAMYQLSQAIASGRVGLQDWNSVVNAGMGGAVFQKSLMRTAENMGAVEKGAVKIDKVTGKATVNGKSFRESIMAKPGEQSWLTSDVLTATLGQLTGDMTDAELAAKGFTAEQIKAIQAQAKSAQQAATQVKTLPQVFDVARETIGSGWAQTFTLIFGDFNESKKTFTEMSNFINGFINRTSAARNKMLGEWKKLGGRDELLGGLRQAFADLTLILRPVQQAFREIFPAKTGKDLFEFTKSFHELMINLRPTPELMGNLKRIFEGVFAVMHIGWTITKGLVGVFLDLIGAAGKGSGGFLSFVAGIGDFLKGADKALTQGGLLKTFFQGLEGVIKKPVEILIKLGKAIAGLFGGEREVKRISTTTGKVIEFGQALSPVQRFVMGLKKAWENLLDVFGQTKQALEPFFSTFVDRIKGLGAILANALKGLNFDQVMQGLQVGFIGGIFVMLKKALGGGGALDEIKGVLGNVNGLLEGFTKQMEAMQSKLKAEALLAIAGAIAVLAAGIFIISTIDGKKLAKAMSAVAIGLGELMGAMKLMTGGMGKLGVLQLPVIAAGMIGLALAVTILAGAMKIFATMSWTDIAKGMTGVAGSISAIGLSMRLMPPSMPLVAAGLILMGVALNLIAAAIKVFASMKWEEIGKGLFTLVDALGGIALGVSLMPPNMPLIAAGLIGMGFALGLIGGAIKKMGELDILTIIKGLGAMMAALSGIGVAMWLMPPNLPLIAVGLVGVGVALNLIGTALKIMGSMGIFDMLKGLVALAGTLVILAAGLILMSGTLPGAAALLAAGIALAVLGPAIAFIGNLDFKTLLKGLLGIALAMGVLAAVGLVAAQPLAMLGVALIPLAAVFVLAAGGVFLFAKAMQMLGATGGKGVAVMVTALTAFIALLPKLVIDLITGLLGAVEQVATLAPRVVQALGVIIDMVIAFVIESAPKLAIAIGVLVDSILLVLVTATPKLISAGMKITMDLLNGISQNIVQVTNKVSEIITKFLGALAAKAPGLTAAGAKTLDAFLQGITRQIPKVVATVTNMVVKFINELTKNVPKIVFAGQNLILKLIEGISTFVPKMVAKGVEIIGNFIEGLGKNVGRIVDKGGDLIIKFIQGIGSKMNEIANKGADAVIKFLHGLADTIRTKGPELRAAGWDVADALIDGIWAGIAELGQKVVDKLGWLVNLLPKKVKEMLGIHSPSAVFHKIGTQTMDGYAQGIHSSQPKLVKTTKETTKVVPLTAEEELNTKKFYELGADTIAGLVKGMKGSKNLIGKTGLEIYSDIPYQYRRFFSIHSPSEVMREIGQAVGDGFAKGLRGSREDVLNAFKELRSKLSEEIRKAKETAATAQDTINEEMKKKKPDWEAVKAAQQVLAEQTKILNASQSARTKLIKGISGEKAQLLGLKKSYDDITAKLEKAQADLEELSKKAEDFRTSTIEKYSATPEISDLMSNALADAELSAQERIEKARKAAEDAEKRRKIDQVANYKKALADQVKANIAYNSTLEQLRAAGLDDTTYRKLVEMGTAGQEFADQLLKGGKDAIDSINALDKQVLESATKLSDDATKDLYAKGIEIAQTVVNGFKSQQSALEDQMTALAKSMVRAIKKELKMKSPSKVFVDIAKQTVLGLSQGLNDNSRTAEISATDLGNKTMLALSSALDENIDIDPTITPVLDLSNIEKGTKQLGDLTNVTPITAAVSFKQATTISTEKQSADAVTAAQAAQAAGITFNQYNTSPESLTDIEIYRHTNNQLAQLKNKVGLLA